MNTNIDRNRHPCFNVEAKGHCGRAHLPVAPKCNIRCNFCNRQYDCVNESRPGVTSAVLTPVQAVDYLGQVLAREPRLTVAGIAGPGDPFANPRETMETLRLVRQRFPELLLCLASNGLGLPPYLNELAALQVSHVTVTVNAIDPAIGQQIYGWVWDGKRLHRGLAAAELLLERQLEAIAGLKERGITVKANTIVIPGVNDRHVTAIARKMSELSVDLLNCMPVYPNADTPFGDLPEPTSEQMAAIWREAAGFLPQMEHCTRCRADAVGLLEADRTEEFRSCLQECSQAAPPLAADRPYVAVATQEGILVNLHLGEAASLQIWGPRDGGFQLIEERPAPPAGTGADRWWSLAEVLKDCRAVLVSAVGETPRAILSETGLVPLAMSGFIDTALKSIYASGDLSSLKGRRGGLATACCHKRQGEGCL